MEVQEFSRIIGRILGSTPATWDERNRINEAMGEADSIEDMPEDVQQLLSKLQTAAENEGRANPYHSKKNGQFAKKAGATGTVFEVVSERQGRVVEIQDDDESRASKLSTVERRIVKKPNICKQCAMNNDPQKVPVHPHCDCDVITDSIDTGVADPNSRFLGVLDPNSIEMELITGALDAAGLQMEPGSVAIMNMDNVRFADFARWLEQVQPYIDAGAQYVTIVTDDDTEEAVENVGEALTIISEGEFAEAIQNKKLWFSIAKAVTF